MKRVRVILYTARDTRLIRAWVAKVTDSGGGGGEDQPASERGGKRVKKKLQQVSASTTFSYIHLHFGSSAAGVATPRFKIT